MKNSGKIIFVNVDVVTNEWRPIQAPGPCSYYTIYNSEDLLLTCESSGDNPITEFWPGKGFGNPSCTVPRGTVDRFGTNEVIILAKSASVPQTLFCVFMR